MKKLVLALMVLSLLLSFGASPATAGGGKESGPSTGMKAVDLLLVRPLSAVGATLSTAIYILTCPFTFVAGVSEPAARILVEAPWRFTGMRYLGDFENYKDGNPITVIRE